MGGGIKNGRAGAFVGGILAPVPFAPDLLVALAGALAPVVLRGGGKNSGGLSFSTSFGRGGGKNRGGRRSVSGGFGGIKAGGGKYLIGTGILLTGAIATIGSCW